ncbi:glucose-methanol-choline oxidoreductase, partial [Irpex lacteus]
RSNLVILTGNTVTRLIFGNSTDSNGNKNTTAVEFSSLSTAMRKQVKVNKEVILAGGAVGSSHVLMHSGVGPKDVLNSVNVPVQIELPGVGQHLL